MIRNKELKYTMLKKECNSSNFNFKTTKEIGKMQGVIGQDRGIKALEFGLNVVTDGYNLYVEGPSGIGKTSYCIHYVSERAKKMDIPNDWCYVYNFDNPNEPSSISLPSGHGKIFKEDMYNFIKTIKKEINKTFNNDDYEKEKALIEQEFEKKKTILLNSLNTEANEQGFEVKNSPNGLYFLPVYDGKTLSEEEFNVLPKSIQNEFESKSKLLEKRTLEVIKVIKDIESSLQKRISSWENNIALLTISLHINDLKNKYKKEKKIQKFLDDVRKDILSNIDSFIQKPENNAQQQPPKMELMKPWEKYEVNLFIDNSNLEGAPVIADSNPTYFNLFGKLEYENIFGNLRTDYRMLKAGNIHKANGGYLLVQARDLLSSVQMWETFKRMIRTKQIFLDANSNPNNGSVAIVGLKPEPIPLKLKVIMLGTADIYQQLLTLDEDFRKLFKIKVEFEEEAPRNEQNINRTIQFISQYCTKENLPHFTPPAVAKVIEYSSRLVDNQNKLSTQLNELLQIISESAIWARMDKKRTVTTEYVDKAIKERLVRISKYDYRMQEMMMNDTILIDTQGFKVGEINGLSVLTIGDYCFGKPSKITANTFIGKSGVINIEREVDMSGSSHSKGVFIISAFLGEKFAQEIPLSLNASVCFEQVYSGVDGDSASSTELYAIISSLSEIPINQSIAVTGSVNQKGEIQPIGGVTEKIEGFFNLCNERGLTGEQGVMIPYQNIKNLNLNDDVIEAVKEEQFHIYAIKTVDEGIEILTGVPAGKKDKNGNYPSGTINNLVYEKLKKYAINSKNFEK